MQSLPLCFVLLFDQAEEYTEDCIHGSELTEDYEIYDGLPDYIQMAPSRTRSPSACVTAGTTDSVESVSVYCLSKVHIQI